MTAGHRTRSRRLHAALASHNISGEVIEGRLTHIVEMIAGRESAWSSG